MKKVYFILTIIGAIVPYIFFIGFFQEFGLDIPLFLKSLFVNGAAGGFSADLLISSAVFWLLIYQDRKTKRPWVYVLLNLTIGLSCALPLYLYFRENKGSAEH